LPRFRLGLVRTGKAQLQSARARTEYATSHARFEVALFAVDNRKRSKILTRSASEEREPTRLRYFAILCLACASGW
jgi:hypothetical protein